MGINSEICNQQRQKRNWSITIKIKSSTENFTFYVLRYTNQMGTFKNWKAQDMHRETEI